MEHNTPSAAQPPRETSLARLEAFSDSVLAVIITIMVLGLRPPLHDDLGSLKSLIPGLLIYVLSFTFIGIYWNNHHHLLRAARRISGGVMWANLHLLFWLSLVPVVTAWVGAHPHSTWPAVTYGAIGFLAGIAYLLLTLALRAVNHDTRINELLQRDTKGKAVAGALHAGHRPRPHHRRARRAAPGVWRLRAGLDHVVHPRSPASSSGRQEGMRRRHGTGGAHVWTAPVYQSARVAPLAVLASLVLWP